MKTQQVPPLCRLPYFFPLEASYNSLTEGGRGQRCEVSWRWLQEQGSGLVACMEHFDSKDRAVINTFLKFITHRINHKCLCLGGKRDRHVKQKRGTTIESSYDYGHVFQACP